MRGVIAPLPQGMSVRSADVVEEQLLMMAAVGFGLGTIKGVLDFTTGQILKGELVEAATNTAGRKSQPRALAKCGKAGARRLGRRRKARP